METVKCGRYQISIVKGDITGFKVDAIVNTANKFLRHGGGVAGAIIKRGGSIIQMESDKIIRERGPLNVGDAVYTLAGHLDAKIVIHTVGPVYGEGGEYSKIYKAVMNSLTLADERGMRSIALPAISTGVYRVPPETSAEAMLDAIIDYSGRAVNIDHVYIVLYTEDIYRIFKEVFHKLISRCLQNLDP